MQGYERAAGFLVDPSGSSPLVAAATWVEGTLLGAVATAIAVICIASIGWLMFTGRTDVKRGLTVVLGCFVLFGSAAIVEGMRGSADTQVIAPVKQDMIQPEIVVPQPANEIAPYDPYAGASVRRLSQP